MLLTSMQLYFVCVSMQSISNAAISYVQGLLKRAHFPHAFFVLNNLVSFCFANVHAHLGKSCFFWYVGLLGMTQLMRKLPIALRLILRG